MKRSEALKKLSEFMGPIHCNGEDAERVLDFIENDLEMSAPFSHKQFITEFHKYGAINANGKKWDEEDNG